MLFDRHYPKEREREGMHLFVFEGQGGMQEGYGEKEAPALLHSRAELGWS